MRRKKCIKNEGRYTYFRNKRKIYGSTSGIWITSEGWDKPPKNKASNTGELAAKTNLWQLMI